jgi:hypothetical protein
MEEIINKYIERGIVEPFNFAWNAPAFLLKKQHGPDKTLVSKKWRVVKDYRWHNMTIRDELFAPPSVQELIDIIVLEVHINQYINPERIIDMHLKINTTV